MDVPNASIVQGWQTVVATDALVSTYGNTGLANPMNQVLHSRLGYRPLRLRSGQAWPGFRHPCRNDGFSGLAGEEGHLLLPPDCRLAYTRLKTTDERIGDAGLFRHAVRINPDEWVRSTGVPFAHGGGVAHPARP